MAKKYSGGFSLIELLATVGILSIVMAGALPQFNGMMEKRRLIAASEAVYEQLQLARTHAVASSSDTYVDFEIDGGANWKVAVSRESGCNPDHGPSDSNPCYIIVDDGNQLTGTEDYVQHILDSSDYQGVNIVNVTFGSDEAKFKYVRGTAKAGSVKLESDSGYRMKVVTGLLGRVRICSPSGLSHVSGYPTSGCSW